MEKIFRTNRQVPVADGPVVLFAGCITPNRMARCHELGAPITMSGAELFEFIDATLASRRETPPPA
ncbi:hypothetical protein GCM10011579_069270 [Streptomyces albiflavescens]|uniref:Uncharacterized protein n=1 Tax=Streptomyces albiflavescens TaxID=1623582 RepID=A0A918D7P4_9ACTN|nr:hypothetical protein [Streptomyces albiflavescens]GGN82033.1 hypothetical protein GCM10011579_069270 [Streptomyces albiflavescens]